MGLKCKTCCHYHKDNRQRCSIYHDSLCEKVYGFCKGEHYRNSSHFISVRNEIRKLQSLKRTTETIPKKQHSNEYGHYRLWEHPNRHYWKIINEATGQEYAKKEAIDLINDMSAKSSIIEKLGKIPVLTIGDDEIWSVGAEPDISEHNVMGLLMEMQDNINELERILDDTECEIEELEMENRRLIAKNGEKDNELDNNDTSGIPFDNNILVPDGSVPSAGAGVHLQVHKGEENHMKMVDDTPLAGNNKTMDILMKMVRYCRLCEDLELDYEKYVDKDYLLTVQKQLECVLDHRDKVDKAL